MIFWRNRKCGVKILLLPHRRVVGFDVDVDVCFMSTVFTSCNKQTRATTVKVTIQAKCLVLRDKEEDNCCDNDIDDGLDSLIPFSILTLAMLDVFTLIALDLEEEFVDDCFCMVFAGDGACLSRSNDLFLVNVCTLFATGDDMMMEKGVLSNKYTIFTKSRMDDGLM